MLIEFSVANFRSIKERQTFSTVTNRTGEEASLLKTGFNAAPDLVASTAIFGPNGSGKSTLILAMEFFRHFVIDSAKGKQEGEEIEITPFLFSEKTKYKPSEFEAVFIHDGFLFQYGFTADCNRVYDEWLYATSQDGQKQKTQRWFERDLENIKNSYIKKELKGPKEKWKELTRNNALFLSTAVQANAEDLKKPFNWIQQSFKILTAPGGLNSNFTARQILKNERKKEIFHFMKELDASFDDIIVSERDIGENDFKRFENIINQETIKTLLGQKKPEIHITHKTEEGSTHHLDFDDESNGTQRLFSFAGPILDVLENGLTLVVDELHNSLHPYALRKIVSLFHDKKMNQKNAQLIFVSHDTNIMNYINRDHIWLVQKSELGATKLTALTEFAASTNEAIQKRYLGGRYGALPDIKGLV